MKEERLEALMVKVADGVATAAEQAELQAHLDADPERRTVLEAELHAHRALGAVTEAWSQRLVADAHALVEAGVFSLVLEGIPGSLAERITGEIGVPTIGIGASAECDGQVLVTEDLLGLFSEFTPKFVKRYAELGEQVSIAAATYAEDVRARRFPAAEHCFGAPRTDGAEVRQLKS